jgi:hypothetical protein
VAVILTNEQIENIGTMEEPKVGGMPDYELQQML